MFNKKEILDKNINNKKLKICSTNPMTGYYRDGYCRSLNDDYGNHLVCAEMDKKFLDYTATKGNDLRRVVKEGEKWCLCQDRYMEAYENGKQPKVILNSTNKNIKQHIKKVIFKDKIKREKREKKEKKIGKTEKKREKKRKNQKLENIKIRKKKQRKTKKQIKTIIEKKYKKLKKQNGGKWTKKYKKSIDCKNPKGFSQKQYCKYGRKKTKQKKTKKKFLYDKVNPKKSMDIFNNENPEDTIPIKYKTLNDLKNTINNLEKLFKNKKYNHKRILQVAMIIKIRLEIILKKYKKGQKRFSLANKYFKFLKNRTKQNGFLNRKNMKFNF